MLAALPIFADKVYKTPRRPQGICTSHDSNVFEDSYIMRIRNDREGVIPDLGPALQLGFADPVLSFHMARA